MGPGEDFGSWLGGEEEEEEERIKKPNPTCK